jgi:hypothetical protein
MDAELVLSRDSSQRDLMFSVAMELLEARAKAYPEVKNFEEPVSSIELLRYLTPAFQWQFLCKKLHLTLPMELGNDSKQRSGN